jgi:cytidylate kinase
MVTISRQAGAGGDEIARLLARELKWDFLDKETLERLLAERGFPKVEFEIFDEKKPGLWHRFSAERDRYLDFLKLVSYDFARRGSCVIMGRGGQILFGDLPGVIRVRVVAPLLNRIAAERGTYDGDERRARHALQHEDNERSGFHRFFFHANWDSPDLYDLVISTRYISPHTAVELIRSTLDAEEVRSVQEQRQRKLADLYLAQQARIAIQYEQQLAVHMLEIEVLDGVITLGGTVGNRESLDRCRTAAEAIPGITGVVNRIAFVPEYVGA